jgi:hypothetical protein
LILFDCAFGNGQISLRDLGGVSVVLLVEGIDIDGPTTCQSACDGRSDSFMFIAGIWRV